MYRFVIAAVLSAGSLVVAAGKADAQLRLVGTGGTPSASLGYYSPVPGTLYSPFVPARTMSPTYGYSPRYVPNTAFVAPNYATGGYTVTQFGNPGYTRPRWYGRRW